MIDKNEITRRLQEWIDQMERSGKHVNLDDINHHVGEIMHAIWVKSCMHRTLLQSRISMDSHQSRCTRCLTDR